ncbi:hypothetical protein [Bacillus sp. FJAT-28004]|uniref:hypothetical protein n=1 Tax=Bacillus sp. FJAT-28004 TaxID=1679165 RepID=UPI0006B4CC49|nr:hypothetical protein [Bacillus sp. FJAT-28004]
MNPNRKYTKKAAMLAATSTIAILLASCQSAVTTAPNSYTDDTAPILTKQTDKPNSPQDSYSELTESEIQMDEPHVNKVDTSSNTNTETSAIGKSENSKAPVKTESEDALWQADAPLLHGIAIGDSHASVVKQFGKPLDSYKLEEETDPVTVLEYDGFAVGINAKKTTQFIELFEKNIQAGLSGLQIGDNPESALLALGKPEKQTTYLLTYKAHKALLKLDLDPEHNEIISIKLLAIS